MNVQHATRPEENLSLPQRDRNPFEDRQVIIMSSRTAFKTFSLTNDISNVSQQDEIYKFDVEANKRINREAPWSKELSQADPYRQADRQPLQQSPLLQIV